MRRVFAALAGVLALSACAGAAGVVPDVGAWVGPSEARLAGPLVLGGPLGFVISYGNVGRVPATGFAASESVKTFKHPGAYRSWYETFTPDKIEGVCDRVSAAEGRGGAVVFPSGLDDYEYAVGMDEAPVTAAVLGGSEVLYIEGCFAYRSAGVERKTGYCYMLVPEEGVAPEKWAFAHCLRGNYVVGR